MKPVEIEILLKDGMSGQLDKMQQKLDALLSKTGSAADKAGILRTAIAGLGAQLEMLEKSGIPDLDQDGNIAAAEALRQKIAELQAQLKQLGETGGGTNIMPPGIPQATKQFNGLHMSIQQMARELPSLAMGPQMFFLAISNNLPIFTDELARARQEYAALTQAGQKATPVWRQVLSSVFSWQTAMVAAIMLLVTYGKEITSWIGGLFKAEKQLDAAARAQEKLNAAQAEGTKNAQRELLRLRMLSAAAADKKRSDEDRNRAVDELQRLYPGYLGNLEREKILAGEVSGAYRTLAGDLLQAARSKAAFDAAVKSSEEESKLRDEFNGILDAYSGVWTKLGANSIEDIREAYRKMREESAERVIENSRTGSPGEAIFDLFRKNTGDQGALKKILDAYDAWQAKAKETEEIIKRVDITDATKIGDKNDEAKKQQQELENLKQEADARRQEEEQLAAGLLSLRRKNQQDEINLMADGTEKKIAQIRFNYREEREEALKQAEELAKLQGGTLTAGQALDISTALGHARQKRDAGIAGVYREELEAGRQAMQEYLSEYRTFEQKRLAITEEYGEKIRQAREAGNAWEEKRLSAERDSRLSSLDTEALRMQVDWGTVFGEFGGMFRDIVEPALREAKAFLQTDGFRNSDQASQEALVSAIAQMEKSMGGSSPATFRQLGKEAQSCQSALSALREAQEEEREAYARLQESQEAYAAAQANGTATEQDAARAALDTAQVNAGAASENVRALTEAARQSQSAVTDTATRLKANMENVTSGLQHLASGGLNNAYSGLIQLGKGLSGAEGRIGEAMGNMAESLENVPVVGWILSIIDIFKDGLSNFVGPLLDSVFNAVSGILDDVLDGDVFVRLGESVAGGVNNILDALTFGGFSSWIGAGESDPRLAEDVERLTQSNRDLELALGNLAEKLEEGAVSEAKDIYSQQRENIEAQIRNTQEMMSREAAAYKGGLRGKHSSGAKVDSAMDAEDWARISRIVGRTVGSAGDFFSLSSKEMATVADEATDLYTKIKTHADDGYKDAAQYMDEYVQYYQELEDLEDAYTEKLASVPFDSVRENFKENLKNMRGDTADFAEDFKGYMQDAMLESMMTETYDKELEGWYKDFASRMDDGEMSETDRDALQKRYQSLVDRAAKEWQAFNDMMGFEEGGTDAATQSGKAGSFNAMSQEQGTKLEGLFTSGQMHWASIDTQVQDVSEQMRTAESHLKRIEENTGSSARHLGEIKEDIKKIIRDGVKMK